MGLLADSTEGAEAIAEALDVNLSVGFFFLKIGSAYSYHPRREGRSVVRVSRPHSMRARAQVTAPCAATSMIVAVSTRPNRQNRSTCSRMSVPFSTKSNPHRLLHQKRIALIKQVVRDPGHLPVPPERHNEVGASLHEHLSVICKGWRAPDFRRSSRDEAGVGWLVALEYSTGISADQTVVFRFTGAIAHQATSCGERAKFVDRGQRVANCQRSEFFGVSSEEVVGSNDKRAWVYGSTFRRSHRNHDRC